MARIPGVPKNRAGLTGRVAYWAARRRLGKLPESLTVIAHHKWVLRGASAFEVALDRSRLVPTKLKQLAMIKVAMLVGCPS